MNMRMLLENSTRVLSMTIGVKGTPGHATLGGCLSARLCAAGQTPKPNHANAVRARELSCLSSPLLVPRSFSVVRRPAAGPVVRAGSPQGSLLRSLAASFSFGSISESIQMEMNFLPLHYSILVTSFVILSRLDLITWAVVISCSFFIKKHCSFAPKKMAASIRLVMNPPCLLTPGRYLKRFQICRPFFLYSPSFGSSLTRNILAFLKGAQRPTYGALHAHTPLCQQPDKEGCFYFLFAFSIMQACIKLALVDQQPSEAIKNLF